MYNSIMYDQLPLATDELSILAAANGLLLVVPCGVLNGHAALHLHLPVSKCAIFLAEHNWPARKPVSFFIAKELRRN